ncbi:MAG TPA: hypothetical protein VF607_00260, partial [Verrucomicrobiae bacterium]
MSNSVRGYFGSVGGGAQNSANGLGAAVPGGLNNLAGGNYTLAAGYNAKATNDGSFVWSDATGTDFGSTNLNSFNVRANGGVRLVTGGAGLTLDGTPVMAVNPAVAAWQVQSNIYGAPDIVLGSPANYVAPGLMSATVLGGGSSSGLHYTNSATADFATVVGGGQNQAGGPFSFVGGGRYNTAGAAMAAVLGGDTGTASGGNSVVLGGFHNVAAGSLSLAAGNSAKATNDGAFVWADNTAADFGSTNANSFNVRANGGVRLVTGGAGVTVDGLPIMTMNPVGASWLLQTNTYGAPDIVLGSPANYVAPGLMSAIVLGGGSSSGLHYTNSATADFATAVGGGQNQAGGAFSFVGGGRYNTASGAMAAVLGGENGVASGGNSVVLGGFHNVAAGNLALAAGNNAKALHTGSFVWADSQGTDFADYQNDQFLVRAQGGANFRTGNFPFAGMTISGDLEVDGAINAYAGSLGAGRIRANFLQVGDGNTYTNLVAGQFVMSGGSANSVTNVAINLPHVFYGVPHMVVTAQNDPNYDVNDTFVLAVRKISATNCVINIVRVDAPTGWSQS